MPYVLGELEGTQFCNKRKTSGLTSPIAKYRRGVTLANCNLSKKKKTGTRYNITEEDE